MVLHVKVMAQIISAYVLSIIQEQTVKLAIMCVHQDHVVMVALALL